MLEEKAENEEERRRNTKKIQRRKRKRIEVVWRKNRNKNINYKN